MCGDNLWARLIKSITLYLTMEENYLIKKISKSLLNVSDTEIANKFVKKIKIYI